MSKWLLTLEDAGPELDTRRAARDYEYLFNAIAKAQLKKVAEKLMPFNGCVPLSDWQALLTEAGLEPKITPEDRAKHQQEVMDSMKAARLRANAVILREEE